MQITHYALEPALRCTKLHANDVVELLR